MIGIIGAMVPEMRDLQAALTSVETRESVGTTFLRGDLASCEVVLLQCGIGKVNAALGTALMIEIFRPRAILNTGSAGGLLSSQSVGDIVIGSGVLHHDVDVTAFGYESGQVPGLPPVFQADQRLVALAREACQASPCTVGLIGSGDVFAHTQPVLERIHATFPDLCAVDMEAATIAQVCFLARIPFVVVRSLSDIAGSESPASFDEFLPLAAKRSNDMVRRMLPRLA